MTAALLALEQVSFSHADGARALEEVSLSVPEGARLAVLGPNGSGKSTLLQHLNGLRRPCSGRVFFRGAPLDYSRDGLRRLRREVACLFQDPDDQFVSFTVEDDVAHGPRQLGLPPEEIRVRVDEALVAAGCAAFRGRALHTLSFGQRKRVAFAGALALRAPVLLLDEPTAGLDSAAASALLAAIDAVRGRTCVLSTHDPDLAMAWADEVLLLEGGRRVEYGPPDQVLDRAGYRPWVLDLWKRGLVAGPGGPPRTREALLARLPAGEVCPR